MTAFKSYDDGLVDGKRGNAQARLDGDAIRRNPRVRRETRGGRCALTQSRPGAFLTAATSPLGVSVIGRGKRSVPPARSVYETCTRITCIDRAIIHAYFHPYDTDPSAQHETGEKYAKRAARQGYCGFLPEELERRLTPLPTGYCRMLHGGEVFLVRLAEDETYKVIDTARGV